MTTTKTTRQNLSDTTITLSKDGREAVCVYALDLTEIPMASEVKMWVHERGECLEASMTPAQARKLAQALLLSADEAEERDAQA